MRTICLTMTALLAVALAATGWTQPAPLVISNCDDPDAWTGGTLETETVHEGTGAIRWDHGTSHRLALRETPSDWTEHNLLSFHLYAPEATGARFMLIIPSENPDTEGPDYYSAAITVDFTGWKRLWFELPDDLQRNRRPLGYDRIEGFYFTASGWGNTPDPDTVVIVDDIKLTWEASAMGPRMSDEEFFAALNLDHPGLEGVREAVNAGDLEAAQAAFVEYLKARETPRYYHSYRDKPAPEQRPQRPNTHRADQALARIYTITSVPLQFEGDIDWKANPTDPFDPEWTWQFGRHHWWRDLGRAYWETGDEKYAAQFVWELRSWVVDNPMPRRVNNGIGSRWRTIECGIRMAGSWQDAFWRFLGSPAFDDDDVVVMVKSMVEHADYLHRYPTGANWLAMEANGMGHVGVLFPEFKRAQVWREDAIARLHRELDAQVYPDGAQMELTPGYHFVSLGNFLGLARICMHNDVPLPDDYIGKLERMWDCAMWAMTPDRNLPPVNDSWSVNVPAHLRQALEYFPERDDFRWIATDGREGAPPEATSRFFPWAGWAVMRGGWARDANYLFLNVGPFGLAHQHEDKLTMIVHAYGKNLLVDVGSYRYDVSPMRSYVLGPYAHSIVLVDGEAQRRRGLPRETYVNTEPQDNPWHTTEALDFCEGVYDEGFGRGNALRVVHRRSVLFVKPDYWLVLDTLLPPDEDEHEYQSLFHLGTEDAVADGPRAWTTGEEANLHILTAGAAPASSEIIKGQEEPHYLGWIGTHGVGDRRPMPVARFTWSAAGESRLLHVLYPTRPGEELPVADLRLTEADGDSLRAEIIFTDGRRDMLSIVEGAWRVERLDAAGAPTAVLQVTP